MKIMVKSEASHIQMYETVYYFKRLEIFPWQIWLDGWYRANPDKTFSPESTTNQTKPNTDRTKKNKKWPFITIVVFILTMVANIVQKVNGAGTVQQAMSGRPWLIFLYPLKMLGIDTLQDNMVNGLLTFIVSFICLGTVESVFLSRGKILFFLLVNTMFAVEQWSFLVSFCIGESITTIDLLSRSCCSSFLFMASLGLLLVEIRHAFRITDAFRLTWPQHLLTGLIFVIYAVAVLNDYFYHFDDDTGSIRTCESFSWHAMNFLFGVFYGAVVD